MLSNHSALIFSFIVILSLYLVFIISMTRKMRRLKNLNNRLDQFGNKLTLNWESKIDIEARKIQSRSIESKIREFLLSQYYSLKNIQFVLYRSGFFLRPKFYIICSFLLFFTTISFYFVVMTHKIFLAMGLSIFTTALIIYLFLQFQDRHWKKTFVRVFPQSLDIIIRSLRSGLTIGRGIAIVSEEVADPVGFEFGYIAAQLELGVSTERALREATNRISVDDFRFFAIALIIQKEIGGGLSDVLSKLSEVTRERDKFRKKVWAMSGEARTTAVIVGLLPVLTSVVIEVLTPGYLMFFINDPTGRNLLWISIGLAVLGVAVLSRLIRFDV